jgi:hypothetical protein
MFVRLTQANNIAIVVNSAQVKYLQDAGGNATRIHFGKDEIAVVDEPMAAVARALAGD